MPFNSFSVDKNRLFNFRKVSHFGIFILLFCLSALAAVTLKSTGTTIKVLPAGSSGSISGSIDSSIPNRYSSVANAVYIYSGNVVPGDVGSSRSPMQVVLLNQNVCQFSYSSSSLAAGTYTIAFTNQANLDKPASTETLTFIGTKTVNVSGPTTSNFGPIGRILQVGANKTYKTIRAARDAVVAGDVIEIDAGVYQNDSVNWVKNANCGSPISNITVRGVGGRAHVKMTTPMAPNGSCGGDWDNDKGAFLMYGSNINFENLEISGTTLDPANGSANGAAIRLDGGSATLCNMYIHDNEDGILGGSGDLVVEHSEFSGNGFTDIGQNHNIYVNSAVNNFTLRYSYTHDSYQGEGQLIKSRAKNNYILYNRITGFGNYELDFPNAGNVYAIGNMIEQQSGSNNTIICYSCENSNNSGRDVFFINNTIIDEPTGGAIMENRNGGGASIRWINNIYIGNKTNVSVAQIKSNNVFTTSSSILANASGYDWRLSATATTAINMGLDPSTISGLTTPTIYEYVHPISYRARPKNGVIDIGAFER